LVEARIVSIVRRLPVLSLLGVLPPVLDVGVLGLLSDLISLCTVKKAVEKVSPGSGHELDSAPYRERRVEDVGKREGRREGRRWETGSGA
jgi:hypothetical protein